jgi:hypothetical protein
MTAWYVRGSSRAQALLDRLPKDVRSLVAEAVEQNFKIRGAGNDHIQLLPPFPNVPLIRIATTPSDHRAIHNVRRDLLAAGFDPAIEFAAQKAATAKREEMQRQQAKALAEGEKMAAKAQTDMEAEVMANGRKEADELVAASVAEPAKPHRRTEGVDVETVRRVHVMLGDALGLSAVSALPEVGVLSDREVATAVAVIRAMRGES